jgi:DnaJ-class molecular chaperone
LGDTEKRKQYDNPTRPFQFNDFGSGANLNDIFSMFTQGFGQHPRRNHLRMSLWISLQDAAEGGSRTVAVGTAQGSNTVAIEIPQGIEDGDNVQYTGIAPGGQDLVVQFRIQPDRIWRREGLNLAMDHQVEVWDLILGGDIVVKNIYKEQLTVRVPSRCQPGTQLRLKGQGMRSRDGRVGDMLVKLQATIPQNISSEMVEAIQKYRQ